MFLFTLNTLHGNVEKTETKNVVKIISDAEFEKFDGLHCGAKYAQLKNKDWRCPSCKRTLRQCIRWRKISGRYWRELYGDENGYGFTIGLHAHHDHGNRWHGTVIICGVCNAADGAIKRVLRLPDGWSFSVEELSRIVKAEPHGGGAIDYDMAKGIFDREYFRL